MYKKLSVLFFVVAVATLLAGVTSADAASIPNRVESLETITDDLQNQINTIELTPGPPGPPGADGADGASSSGVVVIDSSNPPKVVGQLITLRGIQEHGSADFSTATVAVFAGGKVVMLNIDEAQILSGNNEAFFISSNCTGSPLFRTDNASFIETRSHTSSPGQTLYVEDVSNVQNGVNYGSSRAVGHPCNPVGGDDRCSWLNSDK